MPIINHIKELYYITLYSLLSIIITTVVMFSFKEFLLFFYLSFLPFQQISFIFLTEAFFTFIKLSFYFSIFFNLPFLLFNFLLFFKSALFSYQFTRSLFSLNFFFFIFYPFFIYVLFPFFFPLIVSFFSSFHFSSREASSASCALSYFPIFSDLSSFFFLFLFYSIFLFFLPLLTPFFSVLYLRYRGLFIIILGIFIAIITPPDIISLLLFLCPLILFIELSLIFFFLLPSSKSSSASLL